MNGALLLDIIVVLAIIGAGVAGWRSGLLRSAFTAVGLIAGGVGAYLLLPLISAWVPAPEWRLPVVVLAGLLLIGVGTAVGVIAGRLLHHGAHKVKLSIVDHLGGLLLGLVASALALSTLASGVVALGVPAVSQAVTGSVALSTIDRVTPDPVKSFLASVRTSAVTDTLPWVIDTIAPPETLPPAAAVDTSSPELQQAAASVVRVSGVAYECGTGLTGSGFVVSDDRVITNAHVIAGVNQPVVEAPGEQPHAATVVYVDAATDIAVLAVPDLDAPALPLGAELVAGDGAAVQGYPFGGPFVSSGATIAQVSSIPRNDGSIGREVYTLSAEINKGNSGGPLLDTAGAVVGVVFAKSSVAPGIGYALTASELAPVALGAPTMVAEVSPGQCAA